jgi:hypothetical protein
MPQKTVGIPLVGRESELVELTSAFENTMAGIGGVELNVPTNSAVPIAH